MESASTLYIFVDESGDTSFAPSGSNYFSLTCATTKRPFSFYDALDSYKYDLIEHKHPKDCFHCSKDNSHIRKNVFNIITEHSSNLEIDSTFVKKSIVPKKFQDPEKLYPLMLGHLAFHIFNRHAHSNPHQVIIITDRISLSRKRASIEGAAEKAVRTSTANILPVSTPYKVLHHPTQAHYGLQVVDYCSWSIFKKYEKGDGQYYQLIKPMIKTETPLIL